MKTFEEEYEELLEWRFKKWNESDKLPTAPGYDAGESEIQRRKDATAFQKRLKQLKQKYNRE